MRNQESGQKKTERFWKKQMTLLMVVSVIFSQVSCFQDSYSQGILKERTRLAEGKKEIRLGMSRTEVITIAGNPDSEIQLEGNYEDLSFHTDVIPADKGKEVTIGFSVQIGNGVVVDIKPETARLLD